MLLSCLDYNSDSDKECSVTGDEALESDEDLQEDEEHNDDLKNYLSGLFSITNNRTILLPDHVWAAYMCSVHPRIQKHALDLDNSDPEDRLACERLLKKLLVPVDIVNSDGWERAEAVVIDIFLMELRQFQNKEGHF